MAMVRMAQKWSLRYTMIDGQGNFGSIDLDPPAAMRYTEARMSKIADEMLADINKDTVDFTKNFDDSLDEPTVLPNKIPYLMINGTNGIAVGMATNMAPHNLTECIDGIIAYIDNKEISIDELMQYIKAPDFPTGGIIYGYDGVREAFHTGRGHIVIRANAHFEQDKHSDAEQIVVTSVPYQVCKSDMIKRQAALVEEKKIEGISRIKDESNKDGIRIVYKLKRDAMSNVVLNKLYQYSDLQTSFSINNIALVKGKPQLLNLKDMIECFVNHRHEVVERRTKFELAKAEERMHIVEGLLKALDFIDEIINIIRNSETIAQAKLEMQDRFGFTEIQSSAIVEMRLRQLAGLERQKLQDEYNELLAFINRCREILSNESVLMQVIKDELLEIRQKYGDERLSTIEYSSADFRIEDMIKNEEVVVSISHMGYIKRTPLAEYKVQNRGGKGSRGGALRDEDFIEHIYIASMHDYVLFFTEKGKCYWLRAFELPEGTKTTKGRMIKNILNIEDDDRIKAYVTTKDLRDKEYVESNNIIMCTKYGHIKKTTLEAYSRPRQKGILAFGLKEGDELLEAKLTSGSDEILIATRSGKCIRFNESTVRPMGRTAAGVKAISISEEDDFVIGMVVAKEDSDILVVSEHGYGKRSKLEEYRITNRGGKGIKTLNITEKTGDLVAIKQVDDDFDLMIMNRSGLTIRMHVADIRQQGRATQGVKLINIKDNDSIASVVEINREEDEAEEIINNDNE
jgi:DNA gyrase subunit A